MSSLQSHLYDIVFCLGPKDREIIKLAISAAKKNVSNYRNIYVISRTPLEDVEDIINISESIFPFSIHDVNHYIQVPTRSGWYFQQLLKLYAGSVIPDILENYVVIDSDTMFLKPISFISTIKRYLFNCTNKEYHIPYFEHMNRLSPKFEKQMQESGVCHHMIFNNLLLNQMISIVEHHHNYNKPFWTIFVEQVDPVHRSESGASEYELYFNFMIKYHKDKIAFRILSFSDVYGILTEIPYDRPEFYISNHWWVRPSDSTIKFDNEEIKYVTNNSTDSFIEESEIISGERLQELCDLTIITKEIKSFHTSLSSSTSLFYIDRELSTNEINQNIHSNINLIFVYTHLLPLFLEKIWPHINHSVTVMTHNNDGIIDDTYLSFIEDPKLIHLFSQNVSIKHNKVSVIPIGIANKMWSHGDTYSISNLTKENSLTNRENKMAVNFRIGTYIMHRSKVMKDIYSSSDQDFAVPVSTNLPSFLSNKTIQSYKYCACPRGNGPDTHRLWESLYVGTIPLVDNIINTQLFSEIFPIILIDDWNSIQSSIANQKLISFDRNKLKLSWWKEQIKQKCNIIKDLDSPLKPSYKGGFVIAYLGRLPFYLSSCIKQIRIWNPSTPIYIAYTKSIENNYLIGKLNYNNIYCIMIESLSLSISHTLFNKLYTNTSMNNFWKYAMERFFIVEEVMRYYNLSDIIHLEVDNLIYFEYDSLLPVFKEVSKNIAILAPSDNSTRYIAGICYIPTITSISYMNLYLAEYSYNQAEMEVMMQYSKRYPDMLSTLPVIMPEYEEELNPLEGNQMGLDSIRLSKFSHSFNGLFDAAAIGQYMGGIDKIHNKGNTDGYINPHAAYRLNNVSINWVKNEDKKWIELSTNSVEKKKWKVYNIHVHSKELDRFIF
jgi:hypothetical protein